MRACDRPRALVNAQRCLDEGFGVWPRHQRCGRQGEIEAPEFLAAENARHRLAGQAPLGEDERACNHVGTGR